MRAVQIGGAVTLLAILSFVLLSLRSDSARASTAATAPAERSSIQAEDRAR
jgi:hypothetical protein